MLRIDEIQNVEKKTPKIRTFFWKDLPNCNWLEQKIMQVSNVDKLGHILFIPIYKKSFTQF